MQGSLGEAAELDVWDTEEPPSVTTTPPPRPLDRGHGPTLAHIKSGLKTDLTVVLWGVVSYQSTAAMTDDDDNDTSDV